MNRVPTLFLQAVSVLVGVGALAFLLVEPHFEGRNAQATLAEVYFNDAFLAYAYGASIFFFAGLYQVYRVLGYVREGRAFSSATVQALRIIKYCAATLIIALLGAEAYLFLVERGKDDIAGGVAMGLLLMIISAIVAMGATILERITQQAVDTQSPAQ